MSALSPSRKVVTLICAERVSSYNAFSQNAFAILQVLFQNLIVTAGRPGMGMVLGVSAGIVNILLDYIFMVPFHMGIKGAAFGTGIGYMIPL